MTHVFGGDGRNLGMRREIQFLFPVLKFDYHLSRHFASLFIYVGGRKMFLLSTWTLYIFYQIPFATSRLV